MIEADSLPFRKLTRATLPISSMAYLESLYMDTGLLDSPSKTPSGKSSQIKLWNTCYAPDSLANIASFRLAQRKDIYWDSNNDVLYTQREERRSLI